MILNQNYVAELIPSDSRGISRVLLPTPWAIEQKVP